VFKNVNEIRFVCDNVTIMRRRQLRAVIGFGIQRRNPGATLQENMVSTAEFNGISKKDCHLGKMMSNPYL